VSLSPFSSFLDNLALLLRISQNQPAYLKLASREPKAFLKKKKEPGL
jgi:hypothetical protein